MTISRNCNVCNLPKTVNEFSRGSRTCNDCRLQKAKDKRLEKKLDLIREDGGLWSLPRPKPKKVDENARLLKTYGVTLEEKLEMLAKQGSMCGICTTPISQEDGQKAALDHCHKTGKVRAILCKKCNSLLGFARDDVQILQNAIKYLQYFNKMESVQ